ncbi:MAG: hypothetical protein R3C59_05820 [Planctomycetaceae bacterium]
MDRYLFVALFLLSNCIAADSTPAVVLPCVVVGAGENNNVTLDLYTRVTQGGVVFDPFLQAPEFEHLSAVQVTDEEGLGPPQILLLPRSPRVPFKQQISSIQLNADAIAGRRLQLLRQSAVEGSQLRQYFARFVRREGQALDGLLQKSSKVSVGWHPANTRFRLTSAAIGRPSKGSAETIGSAIDVQADRAAQFNIRVINLADHSQEVLDPFLSRWPDTSDVFPMQISLKRLQDAEHSLQPDWRLTSSEFRPPLSLADTFDLPPEAISGRVVYCSLKPDKYVVSITIKSSFLTRQFGVSLETQALPISAGDLKVLNSTKREFEVMPTSEIKLRAAD